MSLNPLESCPTRLWTAAGQLLNYLFGISRYDLRPLLRVDACVAELPVAGLFGRELGRPLYLCRDRETTTFGVYYHHVDSATLVELGRAGVTAVARHGGTGPDDTELVCHFRAVVPTDRGADRDAYVAAVRDLRGWVTAYMAVDSGDLNRNQKMALAEEYFRSALLPIHGGIPVTNLQLPGYLRDRRMEGWQDLNSGQFLLLSLAMGRGYTLTTREEFYAEIGWIGPPLPDIGPRGAESWLRHQPLVYETIVLSSPLLDPSYDEAIDDLIEGLRVPADAIRGIRDQATIYEEVTESPAPEAPVRPPAPVNRPVDINVHDVPDDLVHRPEFTAALQAMVNLVAGLCPNQIVSLDVMSQTGRVLSYKPELTTDDRQNYEHGRWLQLLDQENP